MVRKKKNISRLLIIVILAVSLPVTIFAFIRYQPYVSQGFGSIFGTKANITINLTDSYPFPVVPWSHLAQGGEEQGGMLAPVVSQVANLTPQYIRLDHVFDFYNVVGRSPDGVLTFNWTKLDTELRTITRSGAKPFIALSYMPSVISSGSEIDTPRDWAEWQTCVKAMIEHVSGQSGLNIGNVYYEVWNEPDLFGKFTVNGSKNYLTLYRYAALGATDARNVQNFKFGGPGTTGHYQNWAAGLLDYASKNRLRLDFYSWHRYSKTLGVYEDDITAAKQVLVGYPQYKDVELIITESGYDSENNKANDGTITAIHTLALYAATFQKIDRLFHFEIKDGPGDKQFWGRWGILTHENFGNPVPKPRYRAFEFLNKMRGQFYPVYGQGSWVKAIASTTNGITRVLVVNYDPAGRHSEKVPISFVNMPAKTFTYRRTNFMGRSEERSVSINGTNWNTQETFAPNTAAILEIIQ
jgi:xylan 1,4-beta-xylosidase